MSVQSFAAVAPGDVPPRTSSIKTSVLIDDEYAELAVRALHTYYGLDKQDA